MTEAPIGIVACDREAYTEAKSPFVAEVLRSHGMGDGGAV